MRVVRRSVVAALPRRVDDADVARRRVLENGAVGGDQRRPAVAGRRDDQAIGRVSVEVARKAHAVDGNGCLDGHQMDAGQVEYGVDPDTAVPLSPRELHRQLG